MKPKKKIFRLQEALNPFSCAIPVVSLNNGAMKT